MKVETKVGLLFLAAVFMIIGFAYGLGVLNPFSNSNTLYVQYNFAGGIEVGSPVRVMGIKVGKVLSIDFDPTMKDSKGEEVKLKVAISVSKKAWPTVRQDSRFFINLAGIIGEKFLEITPGSIEAPPLERFAVQIEDGAIVGVVFASVAPTHCNGAVVPGADAEYAISCGYLNWIYCYERANELCPAGYRTLSQSEGYGPKEMRVACRPAQK